MLRSLLAAALLAAVASSGRAQQPQAPADTVTEPEPLRREFRGVWVASVANIDWPSRPGLSTCDQQAELIALLDRAVELRLNAIVLQVRPAGDALYASKLEPWSYFLTGEEGKAPSPYYDPLAFAVREAHARGLELHAWFNPYRAHHPANKSASHARNHVSRQLPAYVKQYGSYLWMDPGEPAIRRHTLRVVLDVVKRYDIDGVHIDDYFYPYQEYSGGKVVDFPDDRSWRRYRRSGGKLARDDWRRRNVDQLVRELYQGVHATKRWVKFGISPFGIWRPGYPEQVTGYDAYARLYADSRKWLRNGWVDYFTPQLYWPIAQTGQSYPVLLDWWNGENVKKRHMWIGNFTSRVGPGRQQGWTTSEVLDQISITRERPASTGNVHFSARAFFANNDSLVERLSAGPYADLALVPRSPWIARTPPARPVVRLMKREAADSLDPLRLTLRRGGTATPFLWVVRARGDSTSWSAAILGGTTPAITVPAKTRWVRVTAVDRAGNESAPAKLTVPRDSAGEPIPAATGR